MQGKILFLIPVYVRSVEKHGKDYEKKYNCFLIKQKGIWGDEFEKVLDKDPHYFKMQFQQNWFSWEYTQIIEFIEIRFIDGSLKAYLYAAEAKRYRPIMNKKVFKYIGKISDVSMYLSSNKNEDIKANIYSFIDEMKSRYKRYFIDTSLLDNIIPLIDFNKLS